ncbi:MAG TPA: MauE/DoxX family redox-associated membrane protein [Desulfomonilia bacterium]
MKNKFSRQVYYLLSLIWPYRVVRIALSTIFIYGGVIKLFDPRAFARTISAYDIIPEMLLPVFAIGLPLVETVSGIGLLLDIRGALAIISSLILMFVFVLGYGISQNLDVDCGCFGAEELSKQAGLKNAFLRDSFLLCIIIPYLYTSRHLRKLKTKNIKGEDINERV